MELGFWVVLWDDRLVLRFSGFGFSISSLGFYWFAGFREVRKEFSILDWNPKG